jgi:hypothetical protein
MGFKTFLQGIVLRDPIRPHLALHPVPKLPRVTTNLFCHSVTIIIFVMRATILQPVRQSVQPVQHPPLLVHHTACFRRLSLHLSLHRSLHDNRHPYQAVNPRANQLNNRRCGPRHSLASNQRVSHQDSLQAPQLIRPLSLHSSLPASLAGG